MPLLVDPRLPEPLVIGEVKYQIKPPTVAERTRWRRAIAAAGGRQHGPVGLLDGLAAGVRVLMQDSPEAAREALLDKIRAQKDHIIVFFQAASAAPVKVGADMTADEKALHQAYLDAGIAVNDGEAGLAVVGAEVAAGYPAYAQMVADETMYWETAGIEAARMFLMGWDGLEGDLVRGTAGATDESLEAIPEGHFRIIGQTVESLTRLTPSQRKNLLSPRPTSSAGETSSI